MAHAKLSPSAAHRWMNCPGSIALIGDESSTSGMAAMKGTAAHKVIEMMIQGDIHDASEFAGYTILVEKDSDGIEVFKPGVPALSPDTPRPGWYMFIVDENMVSGVQVTIDEVDRQRERLFSPEVFPETYLDMSWLDPRFGGTADVRLVEPFGEAVLVDHKNGYMLVEAKDNEQLLNYAVGVLHEHPDAEGVRVIISQPNAPHIDGVVREEYYTRDEIKMFEIRMKEAADAIDKPNAPRRAGEWCTFCPAKSRCPEIDSVLLEEAQIEFAEDAPDEAPIVDTVDTTDLARRAKWVPIMNAVAAQLMGDIQRELENGNDVPGWKLVEGRAQRKIVLGAKVTIREPDPAIEGDEGDVRDIKNLVDVAQVFVDAGVDNDALWTEPTLKSPAQLEKLGVGKEQRKEVKRLVSLLAAKGRGRITIAENHDPREAVTSLENAVDEFQLDEEDEDFGT